MVVEAKEDQNHQVAEVHQQYQCLSHPGVEGEVQYLNHHRHHSTRTQPSSFQLSLVHYMEYQEVLQVSLAVNETELEAVVQLLPFHYPLLDHHYQING